MAQDPFQDFVVQFREGETIFTEGEPGTTMFIVQSGKVRLFHGTNGDRHALGELEKGDFFGEMSILEGLPRTVGADALCDTNLIEINSTIFDKMIRANIEIAIRMLRKLSIRLRETEHRLSEFQAGEVGPTQRAESSMPHAKKPEAVPATGFRLETADGTAVFALAGNETLIGRYDPVTELRPDIDLTDLDLKRSVSRRHARIVGTQNGFDIIEEVGALQGTFVNEVQLVAGEGRPIGDGDRIEVGTVSLIFRA